MNESTVARLRAANRSLHLEIDERTVAENLLRLQRDLGIALGSTNDLTATITVILKTALRIEGIDCGGVYLIDRSTRDLYLAAHQGLSAPFVEFASHVAADSDRARMVMAGEPVYRCVKQLDFSDSKLLRDDGLLGLAIIPVKFEGEVVAAINLASRSHDEIPTSGRDALEAIASQIGGVVSRVHMETALRQSQHNLENLFNTLDDFVVVADADGQIIHVNSVVYKRLGYSPDEVLGRHVVEMHPADCHAAAIRTFADLAAGKESICPFPLLAKDGTQVPVETKVTRGQWDGRPVLIGIARDISGRIAAEKRLRAENAFREAIIEGAAEGLCLCRDISEYPHLRFDLWNDRMAEITGYTLDEINHLGWLETLHPSEADREPVRAFAPLMHNREPFRGQEWAITRADGQRRTLMISTSLLPGDDGPPRMLAMVQDITQRKQMEQELRDSQQKLSGVLDAVADHITIIDDESNIVWANGVAQELFGGDLTGKKCYRVYHGRDEPCASCVVEKTFQDGQLHDHETTVNSRNGERVLWCTSSVAARHEDGRPRLVVEVSRDVTDRKRAEEQSRKHLADLAHVNRLATMGEMASGMAHEIHQPLTAIASYAGTCFNTLEDAPSPKKERLRDMLTRIEQQALRAGQIVRRLRSFVTGRAPTRVASDLNHLIGEALDLADAELKQQQITVRLDLTDSLPPVEVDPIQIEQVVMNLVKNAVDAVAELDNGRRELVIATAALGRDRVGVSVCDSGSGIPAEQADRIFDAFFTTKPGGMGMGLAISRSIIEAHDDRLQMTSNSDRGCTFRFSVPVAHRDPV